MKALTVGILILVAASNCAVANQDLIPASPALDATLAKQFEAYATLESIEERARRAVAANNGDSAHVVIVEYAEPDIVMHHPAPPAGISKELLVGVANADLIIKGIPLQRRSLPIADRSFLYSQYAVRVTQVLSPNAVVSAGEIILVARPGGTLWVNNAFVRAIDPGLQLFKLNSPYYFILRQVPGTNAYRALGSGTFALEDGQVRQASEKGAEAAPKSERDFHTEIERAIAHRPWAGKERR
jgi:hypothetical protein